MSTTITYDNFSFHATDAGTTIYTSDFTVTSAGSFADPLDGWVEKAAMDIYRDSSNDSLLGQVSSTVDTVHYARRYSMLTVGKKYKLTGKGMIASAATNVDNIRFYDGVDYHIGDFCGTADGLARGEFHSFEAEFTAKTDFISFYMHQDGADGSGTEWVGNVTNDKIYLKDIVITEITDGFPTPYVSRTQEMLEYGNRWGQGTSYTLNGQVTGYDFGDLINKQNILLSGFARDYKSLDITENIDIYTSDFSASLDGWGARDDNLSYGQTAGSVTDALKVNGSTNNAGHDGYSSALLEIGKKYRITGKFYIGTGGGNYHGMMIYVGPGASSYVGPWHDTYSSYISVDLGTWVDFDIEVLANSNHLYFYPLAAYSSGPPTNQFVASAADSFLIKDIVVTDLDRQSVAGFPAKNCRVNNITFEGGNYSTLVDYSIAIDSYDETLFSGTYGVIEPSDTISIQENSMGQISLSHDISARGFATDDKSAIQNAKDFVHSNTGWNEQIFPKFITYQRFDDKKDLYLSDFASTNDGWYSTNGGTVQASVGGNQSLKFTANDVDGAHYIEQTFSEIEIGKRYIIEAEVFIGNTLPLEDQNIKIVEIANDSVNGNGKITQGGTQAEWIKIEGDFVATSNNIYIKTKESENDYSYRGDSSSRDWFALYNVLLRRYYGFKPILTSQNENIDRLNGTYSVNEVYSMSSTGEQKLFSGYNVDIRSGIGNDFLTAEFSASYKGAFGQSIKEVRSDIPDLSAQYYYNLVKGFTNITDLNSGASNFSISESAGAGTIDVSASFNNNTLFDGSNVYFDYEISSKTDELTSNTSMSINGTITAIGNKKDRLNIAENFLENTIYAESVNCNNEVKYACYLYGLANEEYKGIVGLNIYTSDFSVDADGWGQNNGTRHRAGIYGGETHVLMSVGANSAGGHDLHRQDMFTIGKKYRISGKFYIDTAGGNYKGLHIYAGSQSSYEGHRFHDTKTVGYVPIDIATWVDFEFDIVANHVNLYFYPLDTNGDSDFTSTTSDNFGIKDIVVTEIPYSLNKYPSSTTITKNESEGTISLSASFDDKHNYSDDVKTSTWSISVKPALTKYIPTNDVLTYPKHIFWNTQVLQRSDIKINASATSYDSFHKSYGLTSIDNFAENVYNIYVNPNSDIVETSNELSFNEVTLNYNRNKSWEFHNTNEWVVLPSPKKP
jgi:hypothetical protein